ncbi:Uncharacterized protein Fot_30313 [Forsythia ovata]|uniref:Uncharacterized protein n=1 Tax=Forsythia ovata TaxID=205694 RepID=A0ABD1TUC8_9LAMI
MQTSTEIVAAAREIDTWARVLSKAHKKFGGFPYKFMDILQIVGQQRASIDETARERQRYALRATMSDERPQEQQFDGINSESNHVAMEVGAPLNHSMNATHIDNNDGNEVFEKCVSYRIFKIAHRHC